MSGKIGRAARPAGGEEDPFVLARFVAAQRSVYDTALAELRNGQKRTHWMWYVFPQIAGLGYSATAQRYAIKSREEAKRYLEHPVLGARLLECAQAVLAVDGRSASTIFGYPDDLKLHSSMTLFAQVAATTTAQAADNPQASIFARVLDKYFGGTPDAETLRLLGDA